MSINVPHYLAYLRDRALRSGVILFQSSLPNDGGLEKALSTIDGISNAIGRGKVSCYVNATGLGALKLCGDLAVYPVRGQTVLVRGEATAIRTRSGAASKDGSEAYTSYCIPRPGSGTTILGGTRDSDAWDTTPDPATTKLILERAGHMVPELMTGADGGFEVISAQCGLRPARKGGPRTEREVITGGKKVVHAYGFAGAGYQNSIGVARLTVRNVAQSLGIEDAGKAMEEGTTQGPSSWLPASTVPKASTSSKL
jgi:glycine/D-amino acid oxidase-like deaminating enzyme